MASIPSENHGCQQSTLTPIQADHPRDPFVLSLYQHLGLASIYEGGRNVWLVILARTCRMLAYGAVSVVFALFLAALDFPPERIGLFMSLTLLGGVVLGLVLVFVADRVGRRRVLVGGACLMMLCGLVFAVCGRFWALLPAAVVGVVTVTGGDFGPFRAIEEAILAQISPPGARTDVLGWYVACNLMARSVGSELAGRALALAETLGWSRLDAYHAVFGFYTVAGAVQLCLGLLLTDACELPAYTALAADEPCELADVPRPAPRGGGEKPGRRRCVVSSPLAPSFVAAAALFVFRAVLNPLDQAPRAALLAAVTEPGERTAVMGVSSLVRTVAAAFGPTFTGVLAGGRFWVAFVVAGVARLAYDVGVYSLFHTVKP